MSVPEIEEKLYSFDEYLDFDDGTANRYELLEGRLELMTPPTVRHFLIAKFLEQCFDDRIREKALPLVCFREAGVRTGSRKARLADLSILPKEAALELLDRTAIFQIPPLLVVEIVSPDSIDRDYRSKRSEYAALGINEYWIVDPNENKVTVLWLEQGLYEETIFRAGEKIVSHQFGDLELTVDRVLAAGNLE